MTAMIEALSFLGPHGPVGRDVESCIFDDSKHAGVCLGTIQARTHVQLALACQRSMIRAQHRLRLTMQHVYGHTGNLRNECAYVLMGVSAVFTIVFFFVFLTRIFVIGDSALSLLFPRIHFVLQKEQ